MQIKLNKLTLENFKGIRAFSFSPGENNIVISGKNGSGKTSNMDAFLWLLFGKDSQGKSDFSIKTLAPDNSEIHNINHSVEADLTIDNTAMTLKKVFYEKWTKKRGTSGQEFAGHTTDFFIDGVPMQKKEWDKRISDIIAEDTLKLLTDPMYFNSLHWQKRRDILLDVCGTISDKEIVDALYPSFSDKDKHANLCNILNQRSIEDHKKVIANKKKEINKQLTEIPARIDELNKSVIDVSTYDVPKIEKTIDDLQGKIQLAKNDKSASILRGQRLDIQTSIKEIEAKLDDQITKAKKGASKKLDDLQDSLVKHQRSLSSVNSLIEENKTTMSNNNRKLDDLRKEFSTKAKSVFQPGQVPQIDNSACPKCNYILNTTENEKRLTDYAEKTKQAESDFKLAQSKSLDEINKKGKALSEENKNLQSEIERLITQKTDTENQITGVKEAINKEKENPFDYSSIGAEEKKKISNLNLELTEIDKKIEGALPPDTSEMEAKLRAENIKLANIESNKTTRTRMEVLMKEEKDLAAEYERLEGETAMIESFIVKQVSLLDEKINSFFQLARFKLFNTQINGGIEPACETLYNGVPYGSGLNTGAQVNIGLDIIRTLSKHYNILAPIFVDHAESVNEILQAGSQMIHLKVSEEPILTVTNLF